MATGHPDAAQLLRTAEAGVLARWAADGRREAVALLLDLGVPVDARGPGGLTALQEATTGDDADLVALLLERGADPDKRAPMDARTTGSRPTASSAGRRRQPICACWPRPHWPRAGHAATAWP